MQLAVMSGSLNSAHESAGKTMSAYSHELVQCHSLQKIASCRGSVFLTTSNDHLALPSSEFELPNQITLVGVGMWLLPGDRLAFVRVVTRLDRAQRPLAVVPVVRRLGLVVLLDARRLGQVELDVERVLEDPLRHRLEERAAVVAGVAADVAADVADVVGERGDEEVHAAEEVVVEVVVRAHAGGEERLALVRGELPGEALDGLRRDPAHLGGRLQVEALVEVLLEQVERRAHRHLRAVHQRHLALAEQARVAGELAADLVARDRLQLVRVAVPVDEVAPGLAQLVRDDLLADRERRRRRRLS